MTHTHIHTKVKELLHDHTAVRSRAKIHISLVLASVLTNIILNFLPGIPQRAADFETKDGDVGS